MLTVSALNAAIDWQDTPSDVTDNTTHLPSKLPIDIPNKFREDKKKKKKSKLNIVRREPTNTFIKGI